MSGWIYGENGEEIILLDNDCFREDRGNVIAWISGENVYSLHGKHIGWFENGKKY